MCNITLNFVPGRGFAAIMNCQLWQFRDDHSYDFFKKSMGVPPNFINRPFRSDMDIKGNPAVNLKKITWGSPQISIPDPSGLVWILRATPPQI